MSVSKCENSVHSGIKTCLTQASDYRNAAMRLGFWSSDKSGFTMVANGVVVFVNAVLPKVPNHKVIVKWPEHKANGWTHHSYCRVQCHTAATFCCRSLASSGYRGGLMERLKLPRRGEGAGELLFFGGVHLTKGSLAISILEPTWHDRLLNTKTGPHKFVGFW